MKSLVIDDARLGASASAQSGLRFGAAAEAQTEESLGIHWISARPEYWRQGTKGPSSLESVEPPPLPGVTGVAFGIGSTGADWIERLARSNWFAGLEPRPEDLGVSGGTPAGRWSKPAAQARTTGAITATVQAFAAQANFPMAPLAMIAVPDSADAAEMAVVLGLVAGLRQRRDARGCRPAVVVTVEVGVSLRLNGFVRQLLGAGAFVIRSGLDAAGDHLHHFALRAAIRPRKGRLVCVDLADHLACWKAGAAADLHVVPFDREVALQVLSELSEARLVGLSVRPRSFSVASIGPIQRQWAGSLKTNVLRIGVPRFRFDSECSQNFDKQQNDLGPTLRPRIARKCSLTRFQHRRHT